LAKVNVDYTPRNDPSMTSPYTVISGDTLSGIARKQGIKDWRDIYNHPDNAGFRRKRPNPDLIFPGDVVMIPIGVAPPLPSPTPPTPSSGVTVIPFHEASPMLISFEDHTKLSQNLEDKPVPLSRLKPTALLNYKFVKGTFNTVAMREAQLTLELLAGGKVSTTLGRDFLANTISRREIIYDVSDPISKAVHSSAEFAKAHSDVTAFIADSLTRSSLTGILDYHVLDSKTGNVPPPKLSFATLSALQIAFGSMQGVKIWLEDFEADGVTRDFRASLIYEWFDHFGADDNTITPDSRFHGTPGQVCLWIMQREDPPARRPFVPKVVFPEEARGKF
jgi:hypothetical protein